MLCNTSAKESIETKGSQRNSERRIFVKKPDTGKVSTRAATAYGRQLKIIELNEQETFNNYEYSKIWDKKAYSLKTLLTYHWKSQGVHYGVKVGRGTGAIIESLIKQVTQENSSSSKKRGHSLIKKRGKPWSPIIEGHNQQAMQ